MGGFLIGQAANRDAMKGRLASAHHWFCRDKKVPLLRAIEEPDIAIVKYGRRASHAADMAQTPDGWLASIGSWSHPLLRSNDNDALLRVLKEEGPAAFEKLDGIYAIAWYTRANQALTVVTDHIGRLHVFYVISACGAFISNSCVALARTIPSHPDPVAVYEMLATGTMYEDRTPFREIRRIPAASVVEFRNGSLHRSTSRNDLFNSSVQEPKLGAEELLEVLEDSVRVLIHPYRRPLSDLTGGHDSRLVVGLLLRLRCPFSVTVSGPPSHPDVRVATGVARRLGLPIEVAGPELTWSCQHSFESVLRATVLSEGGFDPIAYAVTERIHSLHAQQYDLSVNGSGGELFRNYWWDQSHIRGESGDVIIEGAQRFARPALLPFMVASEFRFDLTRHFEGVVARSLSNINRAPPHAKLDHLYLFLRMQCLIGSIASATNQIWPPASPLLQRASLNAVLSLDPKMRLNGKIMRQMYALCSKTLSTYPLENGFPPVPISLSNWWRYVPGIMSVPSMLRRRLQDRRRWGGVSDEESAALVRALFSSGAADFFDWSVMTLRFCLERRVFESFVHDACTTGKIPLPFLGRLIALESVYRAATH